MMKIFIFTVISVFLTIFVESLSLILQLKGKKVSKLFGKNAFGLHAAVTLCLWVVTFFLFFFLQFENHPQFFNNEIIKYTGLIFLAAGLVLATWGFLILGLRRSLCVNFFEDNVPFEQKSIYKFIKNPQDYGLWTALIGFTLFTQSTYNLIIAVEFIIIMIPHSKIENLPLKNS